MIRKIYNLVCFILPFICVIGFNYIGDDWLIPTILIYILTIAGILYYISFEPFNPWLLLFSFILSPILEYVYETNNPGWFQYLGTLIVAIFYALPFTIIAAIIVAVKTKNAKNNKK